MDFKQQSDILKKVLGLKKEPLAISFTNEIVSSGKYEKTSICRALKLSAEGECFIIDEDVSTCPGGSRYCGFSGEITGEKKRRLQQFLTKGEKLTHSLVSFERMQKLSITPPTGMADRMVMCPLEKSEIRPDMVLFLCNGEQACRIIALDTYWDGLNPKEQLIGALCHTAISYTIMSGNTNISMGDWTARNHQQFEPDIIFVSVPYERLDNLIAAIPECSAGSAAVNMPDEFQVD
ncbi:MAG: DUF169 domain-containing protein [Methanobacterium sp.]|nr:DUF169 domain-containing protein [Methanobacterium sp.]